MLLIFIGNDNLLLYSTTICHGSYILYHTRTISSQAAELNNTGVPSLGGPQFCVLSGNPQQLAHTYAEKCRALLCHRVHQYSQDPFQGPVHTSASLQSGCLTLKRVGERKLESWPPLPPSLYLVPLWAAKTKRSADPLNPVYKIMVLATDKYIYNACT